MSRRGNCWDNAVSLKKEPAPRPLVMASVMFLWLARDALLGRAGGAIFLGGLLVYLVWAYRSEVIHGGPGGEVHTALAGELASRPRSTTLMVVAITAGLFLLIGGSRVLVTGAVGIAEHWGVSEAMIGLTLVAVGTSLPSRAKCGDRTGAPPCREPAADVRWAPCPREQPTGWRW
jgi:Ca2+/Na+ antiporter